jgi:hypothetical protein
MREKILVDSFQNGANRLKVFVMLRVDFINPFLNQCPNMNGFWGKLQVEGHD